MRRWRSSFILMAISVGLAFLLLVTLTVSFANPFCVSYTVERIETRFLFLSGRIYWISAEQAGFLVNSSLTIDDFTNETKLNDYKNTYLNSPGPRRYRLGFSRVRGRESEGRSFAVTTIPYWPA